jgi:hypothetical protein
MRGKDFLAFQRKDVGLFTIGLYLGFAILPVPIFLLNLPSPFLKPLAIFVLFCGGMVWGFRLSAWGDYLDSKPEVLREKPQS